MNNNKPILLFFLLIITCSSLTFSQTLRYKIVKGKKQMGDFTISKDIDDNKVVNSNFHFSFLFLKYHLKYFTDNIYENGRLVSATSYNSINDKEKHRSETYFNEDQCVRIKDGEETINNMATPEYMVLDMYFEEPIERDSVYSETYIQYLPLKLVGLNKYMITLPDGVKNYFSYVDGRINRLDVNHPLVKFHFKFLEESPYSVDEFTELQGE